MRRRGILAAVSASVVVAAFLTAAPASAAGITRHTEVRGAAASRAIVARRVGTVNFRKLAARKLKAPHRTKAQIARFRHDSMLVNRTFGAHRPAPRFPRSPRGLLPRHVAPRQFTSQTLTSWAGTSALQQATVNGFDLEPPDQGLCVGQTSFGTYVTEAVNDALTITDGSGGAPPGGIASYGTVPLFQFFNQSPAAFVFDPKCTYNPATQRWIVTEAQWNSAQDPTATSVLVAVSQTNDPTGTWDVYAIDTTDISNANCAGPCFGDQPLLGTDANGIYVSTNEFSIFANYFGGPVVYATGWPAPGAASLPNASAFGAGGTFPLASNGDVAYSLQPAVDPRGVGSSGDVANKGVEWFLATNDNPASLAPGTLDPGSSSVDVWAIGNTDALTPSGSGSPILHGPTGVAVNTYSDNWPYALQPGLPQWPGPGAPLGTFFAHQPGSQTFDLSPILNNDDRMNQVSFATDPVTGVPELWGGYDTSTCTYVYQATCQGVPDTGFDWVAIEPTLTSSLPTVAGSPGGGTAGANAVAPTGTLTASLLTSGSVDPGYGTDVLFPSIGVNPRSGMAVAAFDLVSFWNGDFPSAGYAVVGDTHGDSVYNPTTYDVWPGQAPEDGFTCYSNGTAPFANTPCRWGDYTALAVAPDGTMWFAGETALAAGQRDFYANWGTVVAELPTSLQVFNPGGGGPS